MEKSKTTPHRAFKRLTDSEKEQSSPCLTQGNKSAVREFIKIVHGDSAFFEDINDPFGGSRDILIGTRDRYGISINTVMSMDTGMIRSTPYYNDQAIKILYKDYYRDIYANSFGAPAAPKSALAGNQIGKGVAILAETSIHLKKHSRVLDYGCGIGATLIPFKEAEHSVLGLDYGEDYLTYGRNLGIQLLHGGLERLEGQEPFDLIILSHVLEHLKQPIQFLQSIKKWLAEGGVIYVEVPGIQWVHGTWNHDLLLHLQNAHVWYFTNHTLNLLLSHAGLSPMRQYGSIAVLAANSDVTPLEPDPNHATRCLRYLKLNEWIKTHRITSNRYSSTLAKRILNTFHDI